MAIVKWNSGYCVIERKENGWFLTRASDDSTYEERYIAFDEGHGRDKTEEDIANEGALYVELMWYFGKNIISEKAIQSAQAKEAHIRQLRAYKMKRRD